MSLEETFKQDYALMSNVLRDSELYTGIKNLLIDKSKERATWKYDSLETVDVQFVDGLFKEGKLKIPLNLTEIPQ